MMVLTLIAHLIDIDCESFSVCIFCSICIVDGVVTKSCLLFISHVTVSDGVYKFV